jgi:outer membrane protein insertion porin family
MRCTVILSSLFGIVFAAFSLAGTPIQVLEIEYSSRRDDVVLNEDKIRQSMRSIKGGTYSQQVVDGDIAFLYETGDYTNVQIRTAEMRAENGERGVRLTVMVDPRVRVSEVEVKKRRPDGGLDDNLSVKREELLGVKPTSWETIGVSENASRAKGTTRIPTVTKAGEILRKERLYRDAVAMEECYLEKGYKDVRVTPKTVAVKGEDKVVFEVEEGEQGFIEEVRFGGNQVVGVEELKKTITLKPASWWSGKDDSNCFRNEKLEIDLDRLKDLYANKGFLDVQVTASVERFGEPKSNEEEKEGRVDGGAGKSREDLSLVYRIVEGQRYGVEKISVSGNTFFSENDILKELRSGAKGVEVFDCVQLKMIRADGLTRGRAYSVNGLQASLEILQNMYGQEGFREARVEWRIEPGEKKGDLDIHFKIAESEKFKLERSEIRGNTSTEDSVIRREILLAPGEVFDTVKEKNSKENILKTGLFSNVETYAEETDSPSQQKLIFSVLEKPEDITFGAGLSFFWSERSNQELFRISFFPAIIIVTGPKQFAAWKGNLMKSIFHLWSEGKPKKGAGLQVD